MTAQPWWRNAVIYQVYLRSFSDGDGDGVGDLSGLSQHLHYIASLGVDALWITPFYASPMVDHGYDIADPRSVDPLFGSLEDFDRVVINAHGLDLRVLLDIVPNHTSNRHRWFLEATRAEPGSPQRNRYVFHAGRGPEGSRPPNDWQSVFGGSAWERLPDGEWYLHSFSPEQPDLNWRNEEIQADARETLRFWLDRGVDGFRIDVAHGLFKDVSLRDNELPPVPTGTQFHANHEPRQWDQDEVHEVYRSWRTILDEYQRSDGLGRMLVGEIWLDKPDRLTRYTRSDELDSAFAFGLLAAPWAAGSWRGAIESAAQVDGGLAGATNAWVLGNHDVVRAVTRYGGGGVGSRRAKAAALMMLALPGPVFLYQGDELGLPEVEVVPAHRQDPLWFRSNRTVPGRDGCRVPLPWNGDRPPYGFSRSTGPPWLPQPDGWANLTVEAQLVDRDSMLALHRNAIRLRTEFSGQSAGDFRWRDAGGGCLAFDRIGDRMLTAVANMSNEPFGIDLPGEVVLATDSSVRRIGSTLHLPVDGAVWVVND